MKTIREFIYKTSFSLMQPGFQRLLKQIKSNEKLSIQEQEEKQNKQLRKMIAFAYEEVPYYNNLLKLNNLRPEDIKNIHDLEKLPLLTKEIIKKQWDQLKPRNLSSQKYTLFQTGGTTGTPMSYRVSKYDRFLAAALRIQWWGWGGYTIGDKMAVIGGSSLYPQKRNLKMKLQLFIQNIEPFSSFNLSEENMLVYRDKLNKRRPPFIYGYPSAIYFLANWLSENNYEIYSPETIYTTSEKLHEHMRNKIEEVFSSKVLDGYGLNDGGLHAAECAKQEGYHIDYNRAIFQIMNKENEFINQGEGKAIATSLYNFAMPFINYETGDIVTLRDEPCSCGRETKMLESITGRSVDILYTPEKKAIHGWFLLYIFWEYGDKIAKYQVVQENEKGIIISIIAEKEEDIPKIEKNMIKVKQIIWKQSPNWNITIKFVKEIKPTKSGKYQFIINKMHK